MSFEYTDRHGDGANGYPTVDDDAPVYSLSANSSYLTPLAAEELAEDLKAFVESTRPTLPTVVGSVIVEHAVGGHRTLMLFEEEDSVRWVDHEGDFRDPENWAAGRWEIIHDAGKVAA